MINKIVNLINSIKELDYTNQEIVFSNSNFQSNLLTTGNFKPLPSNTSLPCTYIDGSNFLLLGGSNYSLHLIRTVALTYNNNKLSNKKVEEFYLFTKVIVEKNAVFYQTNSFGTIQDLKINSYDPSLKEGKHSFKISKMGEVVRKLAELKLASSIIRDNVSSIVCLDGSLQNSFEAEKIEKDNLYNLAIKNNITLIALSKTNSLITTSGLSANYVLKKLEPFKSWFYIDPYRIVLGDYPADIFFAKFHNSSQYIFKLDIFNKLKYSINEIISTLAKNSKDYVFPGYPYGMVEADALARITKEEALYHKNKVTYALKDTEHNEQTAHSVLDKL